MALSNVLFILNLFLFLQFNLVQLDSKEIFFNNTYLSFYFITIRSMNIKKSIDLFQLKKDKVSIDTSKELLKYVELSKTTQEIIKELDEKEYQFLGKEGA